MFFSFMGEEGTGRISVCQVHTIVESSLLICHLVDLFCSASKRARSWASLCFRVFSVFILFGRGREGGRGGKCMLF